MPFLTILGFVALYILSILAYLVCAVGIVCLAILMKIVGLLLADKLLYPIFIIGDLLRGIEIVELLNILVFAIVGMAFGLATFLLHPKFGRQISATFLIFLVPLIVISSQVFRYDSWLKNVGIEERLSPVEATKITNDFLQRRVKSQGFLGFYLYTAQFPVLPTKQSEMNDLDNFEKKVNSRFVQLTGIPPTVVTWLMSICFWCLRIFYFAIAIIATIAHFREGLRLVRR